MTRSSNPPLSYRDAGVDIETGEMLVERIKPLIARTTRPGCLGNIGGFGGLFELPVDRYHQPVLVSGTDGVGTKLKLAFDLNRHDTIGIDLVAMCVNDVLVCGAEPLFFLDYFATDALSLEQAQVVIGGIAKGCELAGAALIGGETAEMPGMYGAGEYDLAGFCVGVVEKQRIIDGNAVQAGDRVLGLASSGPHANGYSLIRAVLKRSSATLDAFLGEISLADALMAPTRIYVQSVLPLLEKVEIRAIAHITGGGLPGNIARVIPGGLEVHIDSDRWPTPPVFDWLQSQGDITAEEMVRTFNCGIGLVLVTDPANVNHAREILEEYGETVFDLGTVTCGERGVVID